MRYSAKIKAEIRLLFVQEGKSPAEISRLYDNKPTAQGIINWSKSKPKNGKGQSWIEEREEFEQQMYENLSPQSQADKILKKINVLLSQDNKSFTTKDADALAKLQKVMEKLVDKKFQVPVMFHMLTRLIDFFAKHYSKFLKGGEITKGEFINAIKHFKNELKDELL